MFFCLYKDNSGLSDKWKRKIRPEESIKMTWWYFLSKNADWLLINSSKNICEYRINHYFCIAFEGQRYWRGGRVVDRGGLENRCTARYRGFESLPLRWTYWTEMVSKRTKSYKSMICSFFITINSGLQNFPPNKVYKSIHWELYSQTILFISNISSFLYEQKSKIFFAHQKIIYICSG